MIWILSSLLKQVKLRKRQKCSNLSLSCTSNIWNTWFNLSPLYGSLAVMNYMATWSQWMRYTVSQISVYVPERRGLFGGCEMCKGSPRSHCFSVSLSLASLAHIAASLRPELLHRRYRCQPCPVKFSCDKKWIENWISALRVERWRLAKDICFPQPTSIFQSQRNFNSKFLRNTAQLNL
jgi:hypothetical protein